MSRGEKKSEINKFWENLGILVCSLSEARKVVEFSFGMDQTCCLIGETGIGKTHLMKQIAEDLDMDILFLYLAHIEREDINGIPYPVKNGQMAYEFLIEKSLKKMLNSDRPTLLCLDEWNRGEKSVMNAAFTLMEARRLGSYKLPDHVKIVTAMNPSEANYLVNEAEKDPAFRRRLVMMAVQSSVGGFLEHARGRGNFDADVVSYLEAQPQALTDSASRESGKVAANPAAWEKISDGLKRIKADGKEPLADERMLLIWGSGIIGMGVMANFITYLHDNNTAIQPNDILLRYKKKVAPKIKALLEAGRTDVIGETVTALALSLAGRRDELRKDITKVAQNTALFCKDLPNDSFNSFMSQFRDSCKEIGADAIDFNLEMCDEWSEIDAYMEATDRYNHGHDKVKSDIEGD